MHVPENESLSKNATCQAQRIGQINKQRGAAQNLIQLPVGAVPSSLGAATGSKARAKARGLSQETAQMLGIFALATLSCYRRGNWSLIKTDCLCCGLEGTKIYSHGRGHNRCCPNSLLSYYLLHQKPSHDPANVAETHQLCLILQNNNISHLRSSSTQIIPKWDESTPKNVPL